MIISEGYKYIYGWLMSLSRMRTFIEVYRQQSISRAARSLNLTQPAVSQHIAGLEVAIGRPLFERSSAGVKPTAIATELALDIGDKLDAAEAALSTARARSMDISGVLQIVGHQDFLAEVLSDQLLPLLKSGVKVRLHTGNGDLVSNMLLEGHCDLGITAHSLIDSRLKSEKIYSSRILAVASPVVVKKLMDAKELEEAIKSEPMLAYNLELTLNERWLSKNKMNADHLVPNLVSQDLRTLRKLLVQGFGWSVLPDFLCTAFIESGELVEIPAPFGVPEMAYYLICLPSALRQVRVAHARQTLISALFRAC